MTLKPTVCFRKLPLSGALRHQLASIDKSRQQSPCQKMALAGKLLANAVDRTRGIYLPLSSHLYLPAKLTENFEELPHRITADVGTSLSFFGNALLLPPGYDAPSFDVDQALAPTLRATNAGSVFVSIEHDCQNIDQFEEIASCTASTGSFKEVNSELRKYKDYNGYSIVFSGSRSFHFHFVFDTRHLIKAPFDAVADERWLHRDDQSAIMENVHQTYWDQANELMHSLGPSFVADLKMRSYTQFKRMPWGMRKLDKPSAILGLPRGTVVPQLVLLEKIRNKRSSKGSNSFLVPSDYSTLSRPSRYRSARTGSGQAAAVGPEIINELALMCQAEWASEYPKPASMKQEKGEWIIHFQNHAADKIPQASHVAPTLLYCCAAEVLQTVNLGCQVP